MIPHPPEITGAKVCARVESLEVLAVLPGTALLTSKEAALYINTSPEVLRVWRSQGKGPRFKGRGHFVRYLKSDLDDFMSGFDHRFDVSAAEA
jgi:Helix-turn-helix domain